MSRNIAERGIVSTHLKYKCEPQGSIFGPLVFTIYTSNFIKLLGYYKIVDNYCFSYTDYCRFISLLYNIIYFITSIHNFFLQSCRTGDMFLVAKSHVTVYSTCGFVDQESVTGSPCVEVPNFC